MRLRVKVEKLIYKLITHLTQNVGRRQLAGGSWQEAVGRRLNIAVAFKQLKQLAVRSSK